MREDLIGYLLAALEPHEMRDVERALKHSPALREELEYLRNQMAPIDDAIGGFPIIDAPSDLVRRTMDLIPSGDPAVLSGVEAATMELTPVPFSTRLARGFGNAHRSDWIVAVMSAAAVVALLLPALSRVRNQSRITLCQDQLRQLGMAFSQFVLRDSQSQLPSLTESGPEAFAGMYAVRLADQGLLVDPSLRWCPELEVPQTLNPRDKSMDQFTLVKSKDLRAANELGDIDALRALQQQAGGHYAYTLGVVDEKQYHAPKYEGRATFAVLGDSPVTGIEAGQDVSVQNMSWDMDRKSPICCSKMAR